ncbi:MAG: proline dehydrogenase family protein [Pseudonocardia sp.]|nr:proline dehydrogenase family protein [Pseudonocardia sp.]
MEHSSVVDATLRIYRRLREAGHDAVGTVLQSYLYRTEQDLRDLLPLRPNLRIVKGAYLEPDSVAYARKADVDYAYARLVEVSLQEGSYTAIATHDERLIERIDLFCDAVPRQWTAVTDRGPLRIFARTTPGHPFYARPIPGSGPVTRDHVARVRAAQRALGVPETFEWMHAAAPSMDPAVRGAGLSVQVCPVLVLDGEAATAPFPPGITARLLGPADADLVAAAHAHLIVASAAFGVPVPAAPTAQTVAALAADLVAGRIARLLVTGPDGAVAAGSVQRSGDVAELVGIATADPHRGRGIGAAVTAMLARVARRAGAGLVFLSAGDASATRVYERVGFRHVGQCGIAEP